MIGIVDFGGGNLFSLQEALRRIDRNFRIVTQPRDIEGLDLAILPGVGAFGVAMARLSEMGLTEVIRDFAAEGQRVLGICLGMQMLVDQSQEFGNHKGLGLIPGQVRLIPQSPDAAAIRVPNIGWRQLQGSDRDAATFGDGQYAYFVHSYYVDVEDEFDLKAWIPVNGCKVAAIIRRDNVSGFQFHPEKSGEAGIRLLERAINW